MSDRFLAVHALRIKGLASAEDLTAISGTDLGPVLDQLVAEDLVKLRTGRIGGYTLTKEGRAAHPGLLAETVTDVERAGVDETYTAFLPVNARFKEICTRWQCKDGGQESNDHSDADYDAKVIDDLASTHDAVVAALGPAAAVAPRFGRYADRFASALERVRGGEQAAFARPMSHSYHDVWMELHEDLLLTLGRERDAADGH
ncbi:MarR family transcriptional regulator [Pseudonocardia sp. RS010]|uniref:MarR family transcriptional regulator n=1 Tax=Pseudonocardia sp. RS010 TaxID=3385979 RepID=UPI00399F0A59